MHERSALRSRPDLAGDVRGNARVPVRFFPWLYDAVMGAAERSLVGPWRKDLVRRDACAAWTRVDGPLVRTFRGVRQRELCE